MEQTPQTPQVPDTEPTTYGQSLVGIQFNPANDTGVNKVKQQFADIIDKMDALRSETNNPEVKRLASIAITEAQGAQMWAVKAITWEK